MRRWGGHAVTVTASTRGVKSTKSASTRGHATLRWASAIDYQGPGGGWFTSHVVRADGADLFAAPHEPLELWNDFGRIGWRPEATSRLEGVGGCWRAWRAPGGGADGRGHVGSAGARNRARRNAAAELPHRHHLRPPFPLSARPSTCSRFRSGDPGVMVSRTRAQSENACINYDERGLHCFGFGLDSVIFGTVGHLAL